MRWARRWEPSGRRKVGWPAISRRPTLPTGEIAAAMLELSCLSDSQHQVGHVANMADAMSRFSAADGRSPCRHGHRTGLRVAGFLLRRPGQPRLGRLRPGTMRLVPCGDRRAVRGRRGCRPGSWTIARGCARQPNWISGIRAALPCRGRGTTSAWARWLRRFSRRRQGDKAPQWLVDNAHLRKVLGARSVPERRKTPSRPPKLTGPSPPPRTIQPSRFDRRWRRAGRCRRRTPSWKVEPLSTRSWNAWSVDGRTMEKPGSNTVFNGRDGACRTGGRHSRRAAARRSGGSPFARRISSLRPLPQAVSSHRDPKSFPEEGGGAAESHTNSHRWSTRDRIRNGRSSGFLPRSHTGACHASGFTSRCFFSHIVRFGSGCGPSRRWRKRPRRPKRRCGQSCTGWAASWRAAEIQQRKPELGVNLGGRKSPTKTCGCCRGLPADRVSACRSLVDR